jgi:sigma-B regulation protein RsbU (phosphoserine phosphatase)
LADVVARINDLIYHNTPPEEYITFFVGVYNPDRHTLTYVNAGHNPPLLLRRDGSVEPLEQGGVILGMAPNLRYEQASIELAPEDFLLMYTDGVSEAMNPSGEEFGEERIRDLLLKYRLLHPQEIVE